ncbi:uncharacterized protein LOC135840067 [Planococcus citri]|uniref:uncharacterized protein LOC135840067 n=1 Tax=Planococcus citri TaxID=170843 RepID=UPI0031F8BB15
MNENKFLLMGFGNPIIDIIIDENTESLVDKYHLKIDTQNHLPVKTYDELRQEILSGAYNKIYVPGGCVQNTIRIFQWLEEEKFRTILYGSIGSDERGSYLTEQLQKEGVITKFDRVTDRAATTEDAILLIHKQYRTIAYTSESQAACFKFSDAPCHYLETALLSVSDSKILLTDGYFTLHCVPYIYRLLEQCQKHDILVAFSAGGESIIKANNIRETYLPFVQRSHIVSCNLQEFKAICERVQIHTENMKSALESFCQLSNDIVKTASCKYTRIIVVTDGENPLHCYTSEEGYVVFPILALAVNQIVDTTGAGDAFMAGFLYGISHNKSIDQSLQIGYKTAVEIIQQTGCRIPTSPPNFIN